MRWIKKVEAEIAPELRPAKYLRERMNPLKMKKRSTGSSPQCKGKSGSPKSSWRCRIATARAATPLIPSMASKRMAEDVDADERTDRWMGISLPSVMESETFGQ
jgi:hypothetical protein